MPRQTRDGRRRLSPGWTVAALAALCGILGLLTVLAPVDASDPVITWPQAGQSATSTVVPLSPYRPLQLQATVPCQTLKSLNVGAGGEALRTLPADAQFGADQGLVVSISDGTVHVRASGFAVLDEPLPAGNCSYTVQAMSDGVRATRDGTQLAQRPDLLVPQVAELVTDAQGAAATLGLSVQVHADDRYRSTPSTMKTALLIAHALSLLLLLLLAWRTWRGRRSERGLSWPRPALPDALVVAVSVVWTFLGPLNIDDSWYLLMARNAGASGYIGNYVNMFNSTENPFVLSQYAMQAWGAVGGWGLLWMRLLPLLYGVAGYFLLRLLLQTILAKVLAHQSRLRRQAPWALAIAHLLWWLPYGITLRPEPLIVLGSAAVLLLCEVARQRRSVGVLATATATAALTLTISPTALVAAAPLVINIPWVWQWLRTSSWGTRVGAILAVLAASSVLVPVGFADASIGDVLAGTKVHTYYYFVYPWYQEFTHYEALLDSTTGPWLARLPVLMSIAVMCASVIAVGVRRGASGPTHKALLAYSLITFLTLLALAPTPSKWVNHFGAVAAPATVLLALAMLRTPLPARARRPAAVIGTGLVVAAAAVGFGGPNSWRPFSDWGQPFGTQLTFSMADQLWLTAPAIGPLHLRNPLLWLAVAALAVLWARRRPRRPFGLTADRAVVSTAACIAVVLALAAFTFAPLRVFPGPSIASINASSAIGRGCGLANHVEVTTDTGTQLAAQVLDGHPVFVDQVSAALWPCVNTVRIANGLIQPPEYRVMVGDELEAGTAGQSALPLSGGVFAAISRTARFDELPSRLTPSSGVPILPWGHLEKVVYRYPVGRFDLHVSTAQRSGWQRLPTLAVPAYTGREASP